MEFFLLLLGVGLLGGAFSNDDNDTPANNVVDGSDGDGTGDDGGIDNSLPVLTPTPTDGNDLIIGGDGRQEFNTLGGNDLVYGGSGFDDLSGNAGNDTLYGGAGKDLLVGGSGADMLYGGDWHDGLFGDAGDDVLSGNRGIDILVGGDGNDLLLGGKDGDLLEGGNGMDRLYGNSGNDVLLGMDQFLRPTVQTYLDGRLSGEPFEDLSDGLADTLSKDSLFGGEGDDLIVTSMSDSAYGGAGGDAFVALVTDTNAPATIIGDFTPADGDEIRVGHNPGSTVTYDFGTAGSLSILVDGKIAVFVTGTFDESDAGAISAFEITNPT